MRNFIKAALLGIAVLSVYACKSQYLFQKGSYDFPKDFMWGTSTAAYQIEGNIVNDWSTNGLDAGRAANSLKLYKQDISRMKYLANNSYRFSIEWARVEPEKGNFDLSAIDYYRDLLKELKKNNIKPMVTLHHFTNPVWIAKEGGWENPQTINHYLDFVKFIVNELKEYADIWITINEPNVYAFKAYDSGEFPPYKKNRESAIKVMANLLKAHGEAYQLIHKIDKDAKVGFAHHIALLQPNFILNPVDNIMVYYQNKVFNEAFWNSISTGEMKLNIPGIKGINQPFDKNLKNSMDFIGLNYYTRWYVNSSGDQIADKKSETNDLGWEIYPEGLLTSLKMADKYAKKLKVPIYITENGIDDANDKKRGKYLINHTYYVWKAIQQGIPVKAYMYWSLMDNFEWAEKFKPKFGLYTIDRKIRDSALIYKNICENNSISRDFIKN